MKKWSIASFFSLITIASLLYFALEDIKMKSVFFAQVGQPWSDRITQLYNHTLMMYFIYKYAFIVCVVLIAINLTFIIVQHMKNSGKILTSDKDHTPDNVSDRNDHGKNFNPKSDNKRHEHDEHSDKIYKSVWNELSSDDNTFFDEKGVTVTNQAVISKRRDGDNIPKEINFPDIEEIRHVHYTPDRKLAYIFAVAGIGTLFLKEAPLFVSLLAILISGTIWHFNKTKYILHIISSKGNLMILDKDANYIKRLKEALEFSWQKSKGR